MPIFTGISGAKHIGPPPNIFSVFPFKKLKHRQKRAASKKRSHKSISVKHENTILAVFWDVHKLKNTTFGTTPPKMTK